MYLLKGLWNEEDILLVDTIYDLSMSENDGVSRDDGVIVESFNFPEHRPNQYSTLRVTREGEITVEYFDLPLTPEQESLIQMQEKLDQQQALIDMLILDSLGGAE